VTKTTFHNCDIVADLDMIPDMDGVHRLHKAYIYTDTRTAQ